MARNKHTGTIRRGNATIYERTVELRDGNPVTVEYRTITTRKLRRQAIKNAQGNNRIHDEHVQQQVKAHPALIDLYRMAQAHGGQHRQCLLDQISRGCAV